MSQLSNPQRQLLLQVARRALVDAVHTRSVQGEIDFVPEANSFASFGAFVTLHSRSRLRGCIGQVGAHQPVAPLVAYCARAAALQDPRFRPVEGQELAEIEIELSVLSAPEDVTLERIEIGKHGLMVSRGGVRGLLLPQVASQYGWSAARFLEETCVKAGLERDAWTVAGTRVQAFTAEVFSESELYAAPAATSRNGNCDSGY